jgi:hypothetical protein
MEPHRPHRLIMPLLPRVPTVEHPPDTARRPAAATARRPVWATALRPVRAVRLSRQRLMAALRPVRSQHHRVIPIARRMPTRCPPIPRYRRRGLRREIMMPVAIALFPAIPPDRRLQPSAAIALRQRTTATIPPVERPRPPRPIRVMAAPLRHRRPIRVMVRQPTITMAAATARALCRRQLPATLFGQRAIAVREHRCPAAERPAERRDLWPPINRAA